MLKREGDILKIEEVSCVKLAEKYGTPLFIYSEKKIRENCRAFYNAFKKRYPNEVVVCVGFKANYNLALRKIVIQERCGGDCFGYEMYLAILTGQDPEKTVLNGPGKNEEIIRLAIQYGAYINVDSLRELERIIKIAQELKKTAKICPRIRLPLKDLEGRLFFDKRYIQGIDIAIWEREFKFGLEPNKFFELIKKALKANYISLEGIHYHGGLPRRAGFFKEEILELMDYVGYIKEKLNWEPRILNIGGGFISTREGYEKQPPTVDEYAEVITNVILSKCKQYNILLPRLYIEPGRWHWENAAIYLVGVIEVKEDNTLAKKKWIYTDGSINELCDPFDPFMGYHKVVIANRPFEEPKEVVDVCGQLCNAADIIAKNIKVPPIKEGDLLAIMDVGAYNESFANQSNAKPRSAAVLVNDKHEALIKRRETYQDVINRDLIPYWLA